MEFYYINSKGEKLNLYEWPYMLMEGGLFDYKWNYTKSNNKISNFSKEAGSCSIKIAVKGSNDSEYINAVNRLHEIVDYDVVTETPGRLYVDNQYIRCYITESKKQDLNKVRRLMINTLKVSIMDTRWITERSFEFIKLTSKLGKKYPYRYNYRYSAGSNTALINEHFVDSDFKLTIHGPCANPEIQISDHVYSLTTTLNAGETVTIDSSTGTIVKTDKYGNKTNSFHSCSKNRSVFKKIPPGLNIVEWQGEFAFNITLLMERSEPLWT